MMIINKRLKKLLFICVIVIMLCSLIGCAKTLNHQEGIALMQNSLANSLKYDVFYWKEIIREGNTVEANYVNVHADVNNTGFILDENDGYTNYAIHIDSRIDNKTMYEIYCGLSKSSQIND